MTQESTPGHIPGENHNSKRYMHHNVHYSTIYNSQDMEATSMPINREMDKAAMYISKMESYSAIKRNTLESVLMKWMNLEPIIREKQISYINSYKWNLERWYGWTYYRAAEETQTWRTDLWTWRLGLGEEGEGWLYGESNTVTQGILHNHM